MLEISLRTPNLRATKGDSVQSLTIIMANALDVDSGYYSTSAPLSNPLNSMSGLAAGGQKKKDFYYSLKGFLK